MKSYSVFEMQTNREMVTAHLPPVDRADINEALSEFYYKCAFAAKSDVYVHTVMLCSVDGVVVDYKSFMHGEEPTEEPTEESTEEPI